MKTLGPIGGTSWHSTNVYYRLINELVGKQIGPQAKQFFIAQIMLLKARDAEGIIFGCTELPMLIKPGDVAIPMLSTTDLHAEMAADFYLGNLDLFFFLPSLFFFVFSLKTMCHLPEKIHG